MQTQTIQIELQNELAAELMPYRDNLAEVIELGLREWQEREARNRVTQRKNLLEVLAHSDKVRIPQPYIQNELYTRHTPISVDGKLVSELVVEQRGAL